MRESDASDGAVAKGRRGLPIHERGCLSGEVHGLPFLRVFDELRFIYMAVRDKEYTAYK